MSSNYVFHYTLKSETLVFNSRSSHGFLENFPKITYFGHFVVGDRYTHF